MNKHLILGLCAALYLSFAVGALRLARAATDERCPQRPENHAAARKTAARWYGKGLAHYKKKQYTKAVVAFRCAQSILPVRLTRYWIARSAQKATQYRTALRIYQDLLVDPPRAVSKEELKQRITKLKPLAARQKKRPARPTKNARLGPTSAGGNHPGTARLVHQHAAEDGAKKRKTYTIAGWVATAVGTALVATGIGLGIQMAVDKKKIEDPAEGTGWYPDLKKRYDRHDSLQVGTGVCVGLGAGALVAGTVLLFLRPKEKPTPTAVRIEPSPAAGGAVVNVTGRF